MDTKLLKSTSSYCGFDRSKTLPVESNKAAGNEGAVSSCWLRFEVTDAGDDVQLIAVAVELPWFTFGAVPVDAVGVAVIVAFDDPVAVIVLVTVAVSLKNKVVVATAIVVSSEV
jgi:hypothetical protein